MARLSDCFRSLELSPSERTTLLLVILKIRQEGEMHGYGLIDEYVLSIAEMRLTYKTEVSSKISNSFRIHRIYFHSWIARWVNDQEMKFKGEIADISRDLLYLRLTGEFG